MPSLTNRFGNWFGKLRRDCESSGVTAANRTHLVVELADCFMQTMQAFFCLRKISRTAPAFQFKGCLNHGFSSEIGNSAFKCVCRSLQAVAIMYDESFFNRRHAIRVVVEENLHQLGQQFLVIAYAGESCFPVK